MEIGILLILILGLSSAFALFWIMKSKKKWPAVISLGMIIGMVMEIFPFMEIQNAGIYIYMGFVLLAS